MTSIKFRTLTPNDYKLFFEALGEHGKDFQNIQQYMAQKCGKSNNKSSEQNNKSIDPHEKKEQEKKEDDKKREQIRYLYNKLYGNLSQLIGKLDDRVEKVNQELYLLINYGEIWKKHSFIFNNKTKKDDFIFNKKTKKLLEELVHQGTTTFRFKNKNVRLRTPPCKALKKINEIGIDEKVKVVTTRELPKDVIVEFRPATNRDWIKVQSMSQNPRVRARLSIQKRLFNILGFLENKWNISQDKLNRTVDAWLKVPPNNQPFEDLQQQQCPTTNNTNNYNSSSNTSNLNSNNGNLNPGSNIQNLDINNGMTLDQNHRGSANSSDIHLRLRLKPSAQHELNEVNITRVVPDNHLDLSLNAYIGRLGDTISKSNEPSSNKNNSNSNYKDSSSSNNNPNPSQRMSDDGVALSENLELSQGAMSSSSRLPLSLTTPDSSILLERSMTCDQPSIAQTRKHLNILQSLAGSFGGCENSRTACEDTQDRSLMGQAHSDNRTSSFGGRMVSFADTESYRVSAKIEVSNNSIPALFDEDAAIDNALPIVSTHRDHQTNPDHQLAVAISSQQNSDSQSSKSVDFHIPKDLTLAEFFKMNGQTGSSTVGVGSSGGDDANHSFPVNQIEPVCDETENIVDNSNSNNNSGKEELGESRKAKSESSNYAHLLKPHNHMIEIKKLAEGWTRQDESPMTIGELYLAFKCPDTIVLEYNFEQFTATNSLQSNLLPITRQQYCNDNPSVNTIDHPANTTITTSIIPDQPPKNTLIFKLLTAASLSLAHIERQKQQHKLHDLQAANKMKRRKGPTNPNTIKYLKRDASSSTTPALQSAGDGSNKDQQLSNNNNNNNNNYIGTGSDKSQVQGQVMTLHDIEATNQRVEEALKQLQPTRLSVFRRAR